MDYNNDNKKKNKRRGKGEGSIIKLPNGKYKMTITIGVGLDGKQKRKAVTKGTKRELLEAIDKIKAKLLSPAGKANKPKVTFSNFATCFEETKMETQLIRKSTYTTHRMFLKSIEGYLGDYYLHEITTTILDDLFRNLINVKKYSPMTLRHIKKFISCVFNEAIRQKYLTENPCDNMMKLPRITNKKVDLLLPTERQIKEWLSKAKQREDKLVYKAMLLAIYTGMRLGEIGGLSKSCINTDEGSIDVKSQLNRFNEFNALLKNESSRRKIYVSKEVLNEVLMYCDEGDTYIFTTTKGKHCSYATLQGQIGRFLRSLEDVPKGFSFHSFRHYHATTLLSKGVSIKEVSKRLGHSSIAITADTYSHWLDNMDKKAATVIENLF